MQFLIFCCFQETFWKSFVRSFRVLFRIQSDSYNRAFAKNSMVHVSLDSKYGSEVFETGITTVQRGEASFLLTISWVNVNGQQDWIYPDLQTLREKCPNTEFFWSVVSCIQTEYGKTEYLSVFSPNTGKYRTEKTPYLDTFHAVQNCSEWKT